MLKINLFSKLICLLLAAYCLLPLTGCKKKETKAVAEKTFNVQVKPVETKSLRPFIEATGTLNPNEEIFVSAEIEGILKSVHADEGTIVSKGMLLASINDMDYVNEVKRDEAALKQTEATLANTKLEFTRKEALYKEELVTQQQFDDVTTRLALAEAERERVRALLSIAKQKLTKTKIHAPLSCVVKEKKISVGDFVKVGNQLFILIQSNPIKLQFAVPEKDVGKLKTGQDALLKVDAFPGKEFKGKVSIIYPSLEEKTRTLLVEALVPNPGNTLKPGLFAKVMLYTGIERNTVVIPITALLYEADKIKIFVVDGDRAKQRLIKVGSKYGELMEVVEGVREGEKVVIAGQQNLSEGVKVNVQQPKITKE
jgi:RND family efflux transporter MFP subunit